MREVGAACRKETDFVFILYVRWNRSSTNAFLSTESQSEEKSPLLLHKASKFSDPLFPVGAVNDNDSPTRMDYSRVRILSSQQNSEFLLCSFEYYQFSRTTIDDCLSGSVSFRLSLIDSCSYAFGFLRDKQWVPFMPRAVHTTVHLYFVYSIHISTKDHSVVKVRRISR